MDKKINIAEPWIDLEEMKAVINVLKSGNLAHGKVVEEFENSFAKYIGTKYAVAVNSGTAALCLGIQAMGLKNEHIITTPFSFIASTTSILYNNCIPIFVDIDNTFNIDTFNIDPFEVENALRTFPSIKNILLVHLYGQPCDMSIIMELAEKYNLNIIEDCCQAHGSQWNGKKVGSFGRIGCFSFYPTKNMTTFEGGMVTTNDENIYKNLLMLRNHGQSKRYHSDILSYNYRMTNANASVGITQLNQLDMFNDLRNRNAKYFNDELEDIEGISIPLIDDRVYHVYNQYTIIVHDECKLTRDDLSKELNKRNITT
jgi:perosamine synthetase